MTTETLEKNTPNLDEPLPTPTPLTINGQSILFPPLPFDLKARADLATKDEKLQQFVKIMADEENCASSLTHIYQFGLNIFH